MNPFQVRHVGQSTGVRFDYVVKVFKSREAADRFAEKKNDSPGREGTYLVRESRQNFFGSSVTYSPTANKKAFTAGKSSGDTGLFDKWYKKSGYEKKGYDKTLHPNLELR